MAKTAFIYPGQASQFVGMAKDIVENSPQARERFEQANEIMGADLMKIAFEGPEDELRQTMYTQPAIFVHSVIVTELIGNAAEAAAGHSLGEYSALVAAGAFSFEDGLKLVKKRGELMQESGTRSPGTMAAVIGMEENVIREACAEVSAKEVVQPANFNSPGQVVISGSVAGIDLAMEALKARGARIVKKLPVSGAFHSPLMQYAQDEIGAVLDTTPISDAAFPVYANVTAGPVQKADEIKDLLFKQMTSPVLWEQSMRNMVSDGVNRMFEIGPGNVLQGLMKRIDSDVECKGIGTWQDIQTYLETTKG